MAWGWGALFGAGAAILGGFFTGGLTWGLLAAGAAGAAVGAGAGETIAKIGDTLSNKAKAAGISPQELMELQKMRDSERKKWVNDNNEDVKELNAKIDKIEEQRQQVLKKLETENDPTEKAKLIALADQLKQDIADLKKERRAKETQIKEVIDNLPKQPMTPQQFQQEQDKPFLGSFKNWGIIAIFVVLAIILINFIKRLFNKLTDSITK